VIREKRSEGSSNTSHPRLLLFDLFGFGLGDELLAEKRKRKEETRQ